MQLLQRIWNRHRILRYTLYEIFIQINWGQIIIFLEVKHAETTKEIEKNAFEKCVLEGNVASFSGSGLSALLKSLHSSS